MLKKPLLAERNVEMATATRGLPAGRAVAAAGETLDFFVSTRKSGGKLRDKSHILLIPV